MRTSKDLTLEENCMSDAPLSLSIRVRESESESKSESISYVISICERSIEAREAPALKSVTRGPSVPVYFLYEVHA